MSEKKDTPKRMGRPPIEIDWDIVKGLCEIMCTQVEICSVLGISVDTLTRACKAQHNMTCAEYIKSHQEIGKSSLRRAQFSAAMKGNPTMLIWMGKQFLDQSDKSEVTQIAKRNIEDYTDEELRTLEDAHAQYAESRSTH